MDPTREAAHADADTDAIRRRAVEGVRELCHRAADAGRLDLPTLTREELRTMGDGGVVPDEGDLAWWRELTDDVREQVASAAARGLLARDLVVSGTSGERVPGELAPELILALATRRDPAAVLSVGPADGTAADPGEPRLQGYLLDDSDGAGVLVLLEQVHDGLHRLELCTTSAAAERLSSWLSRGSGEERALVVVRAGAGEVGSLRVRRDEAVPPTDVVAVLERAMQDTDGVPTSPPATGPLP